MEAREEVEGTDDPESLQRLSVANQRRQDALVQQIAGAFREGADQQAAALTQQLTYLVRIQQAIMHKL
jgi:DnaJ-domain-containing protein 1